MGFTKEEYEAKYEEMFVLMKQQIEVFKAIIEEERQRINNTTS